MEAKWVPLGQSLSDKLRAAHYRWVGMAPGLTPELASKFMLGLHGGKTIRDMTDAKNDNYICSMDRFRKHCELDQEWGAEARKKSWANFTAKKKANNVLGLATREVCLKGLHPMKGDNLRIDPSTGRRACLACRNFARDNPPMMTPEVLAKVKRAFQAGSSQSEICNGHPVGGGKVDKSLRLTTNHKFYQQRRLDPEFDKFVAIHIADSNRVGQRIRWLKFDLRKEELADKPPAKLYNYEWSEDDYRRICDLVPVSFPNRGDVINSVFLELFEGTLEMTQAERRVRKLIAANDPRRPAKFGRQQLLSLDVRIYEQGVTTLGDTVSRGLWD